MIFKILLYIIKNKLDFLEGNIIKSVTRYKNKNGVEDLIKAPGFGRSSALQIWKYFHESEN